MEFQYLDIEFSELPVRKIFEIDKVEYDFEFSFNSVEDSIICIVRNVDGEILFSSPVVYGRTLNDVVVEGFDPATKIIPLNLDAEYSEKFENILVTKENFGNPVRLYIGQDA